MAKTNNHGSKKVLQRMQQTNLTLVKIPVKKRNCRYLPRRVLG